MGMCERLEGDKHEGGMHVPGRERQRGKKELRNACVCVEGGREGGREGEREREGSGKGEGEIGRAHV